MPKPSHQRYVSKGSDKFIKANGRIDEEGGESIGRKRDKWVKYHHIQFHEDSPTYAMWMSV